MIKANGWLVLLLAVFFSTANLHSWNEAAKKYKMSTDLVALKHAYEVSYAPMKWKREYGGWDFENAYKLSFEKIFSNETLSTQAFRKIVRDLSLSLHDYHVHVFFHSTEEAILPFTVCTVEDRYFVDWVNPFQSGSSCYQIAVGDELLEFDGRPIVEAMEHLKEECGSKCSNPLTDADMLAKRLTARKGVLGDVVPKGTVMIKMRSQMHNSEESFQMIWKYYSEKISLAPLDNLQALMSSRSLMKPSYKWQDILGNNVQMVNPMLDILSETSRSGLAARGVVGARQSFVPKLGKVIWDYSQDSDDSQEQSSNPLSFDSGASSGYVNGKYWNAYIYRHFNGSAIGYLRIPTYKAIEETLEDLREIIEKMETETDALVIDQVNNPGGHLLYMYDIASLFAVEPLIVPRHRVKLTHSMIHAFYYYVKAIEKFEEQYEDNDTSHSNPAEHSGSSQVDFQLLLLRKNYFQTLIQEWNEGRSFSYPTSLLGIDRINPCVGCRYTKPILLLINHLDFSCGDFLPAIMQDNKRALLFGARTAGAGGCVSTFDFQSHSGISQGTTTYTIAERADYEKIENLGVTPDIEYEITAEDLMSGYEGYKRAVNEVINLLHIESSPPS